MVEQPANLLVGGSSILTSPLQLLFRAISYWEATVFLVENHYLHRRAPTSFSFGAFSGGALVGACTIGKPASYTLLNGVCGKEQSKRVFELNRLFMSEICPHNSESRFLGWVLRSLPKDLILVSYADTAYGHVGKVYQATNWIYTGTSVPWVDYTRDGLDHRSIPKGERNKENLTPVIRSLKHRYVYFCDPKSVGLLCWKVKEYPKGRVNETQNN